MNVLTISGNLGKDAVVRKAGDQSVAGFSIAMKSGYGDKAQTIWVDCSLWGKQAESGLVQYLKKGQFVVLSGEMGTREHEGKTYITLSMENAKLEGANFTESAPQQGVWAQPSTAPQQPQRPVQQPQNNGYAAARNAPQQPTNFDDDSIPF